jgi:hypothetical protein
MSNQPKEPGFYWLRDPGAPWTVAAVYDSRLDGLRVAWMHSEYSVLLGSEELASVEWGPRIEPPA